MYALLILCAHRFLNCTEQKPHRKYFLLGINSLSSQNYTWLLLYYRTVWKVRNFFYTSQIPSFMQPSFVDFSTLGELPFEKFCTLYQLLFNKSFSTSKSNISILVYVLHLNSPVKLAAFWQGAQLKVVIMNLSRAGMRWVRFQMKCMFL